MPPIDMSEWNGTFGRAVARLSPVLVLGGTLLAADPRQDTARVEAPVGTDEPQLVAAAAGASSCMLDRSRERLYCTRASRGTTAIVVRRRVDGGWDEGRTMSFSGSTYDLDPFPDPAGDRLLFVSFRPPRWNMDLWSVDTRNATRPQPLPDPVNSAAVERSPSLGATGTLYFLREDTIYQARPGDAAPSPLSGDVNAPGRKFDACVAPDESFLVFTSDRPGGYAPTDLYLSVRRGREWSAGVNLGPRVNSGRDIARPGITADGRHLCWSGARDGVEGLYCVETRGLLRAAVHGDASAVTRPPTAPPPSGVAGRWQGEITLLWADGRTARDPLWVVLRQFGTHVEGRYGRDERSETRFKRARLEATGAVLESDSLRMRLSFAGDAATGEAVFGGPGAPAATVSLHRTQAGNGGATAPERRSVSGRVEVIEDFELPQLGRRRRVWVYLPPGYEASGRRFPVLYMQDGQNLFDVLTSDRGEWGLDETIEGMVSRRESTGLIVVGVEHGGPLRVSEYTPAWLHLVPNPEGDAYARFLVETLKPHVDRRYRTLPDREHTAVAGSSAGAQIAFHVAAEYPHVFSRVGALGFAMGRGAPENNARWCASHRKSAGMRFYLHVSTREGLGGLPDTAFVENLKDLGAGLRSMGYSDGELLLDIDDGGRHDEDTWSRRLPRMLRFLFGGERPTDPGAVPDAHGAATGQTVLGRPLNPPLPITPGAARP